MYPFANSNDLYKTSKDFRLKYPYPAESKAEDLLAQRYGELIKEMFFELIMLNQSYLLSWFCDNSQIKYTPKHFSFAAHGVSRRRNNKLSFDIYPIVQSLQALFRNDPGGWYEEYKKNAGYLFVGYTLPQDDIRMQPTLDGLKYIDEAIEKLKGQEIRQEAERVVQFCNQQKDRIRSQEQKLAGQERLLEEKDRQLAAQERQIEAQKEQLAELERRLAAQKEQERQPAAAAQESKEELPAIQEQNCAGNSLQIPAAEVPAPGDNLPMLEKLRIFADSRQKEDADLLRRIQQLQADLRENLQEVAKIREGLEYETLRESISQFLAIHDLLWDILESHPMQDSATGYENLMESCKDLRDNIVQALAMLGVVCIDGAGDPFAPDIHRTSQGVQPTRNAIVEMVLRPGFSYRSKTLEKAVVKLR